MILSLTLFAVGVFCYGIKELQSHGKLKWMKGGITFWGPQSHGRKWLFEPGHSVATRAPKTWYYRTFNLVYKERFPLSATALVFLTDGYHLMQWLYLKLFILSIVLYSPVFGWWKDGLIYLGVWYLTFSITYKVFSR